MLNYPVEIITKIDDKIVKGNLITYQNLLTKDIYSLKLSTPLENFSPFNGTSINSYYGGPELSFIRYDGSWNPTEAKDKSGLFTTYLWSYNRQLRIADIVNQIYNRIIGTAFAEGTVAEQGKQPCKYNGKELDQMHGLNLYDYSARYYEPAIGRFTTVDPLRRNTIIILFMRFLAKLRLLRGA